PLSLHDALPISLSTLSSRLVLGRASLLSEDLIWTSPCSDMSATSTRATPSGIRNSAEISAMDRHSWHRSLIACHSGVSVPDSSRAVDVAEIRASNGSCDFGLVRPLVTA